MKKKLLFIPLLFVLILAVGYIFLCSQVLPFSNEENTETVKIEIQYGESTQSIINKLKENNLIKNEKWKMSFVNKFIFHFSDYTFKKHRRNGAFFINIQASC